MSIISKDILEEICSSIYKVICIQSQYTYRIRLRHEHNSIQPNCNMINWKWYRKRFWISKSTTFHQSIKIILVSRMRNFKKMWQRLQSKIDELVLPFPGIVKSNTESWHSDPVKLTDTDTEILIEFSEETAAVQWSTCLTVREHTNMYTDYPYNHITFKFLKVTNNQQVHSHKILKLINPLFAALRKLVFGCFQKGCPPVRPSTKTRIILLHKFSNILVVQMSCRNLMGSPKHSHQNLTGSAVLQNNLCLPLPGFEPQSNCSTNPAKFEWSEHELFCSTDPVKFWWLCFWRTHQILTGHLHHQNFAGFEQQKNLCFSWGPRVGAIFFEKSHLLMASTLNFNFTEAYNDCVNFASFRLCKVNWYCNVVMISVMLSSSNYLRASTAWCYVRYSTDICIWFVSEFIVCPEIQYVVWLSLN